MSNQQDNFEETVQRTFTWRRSALHAIHHAIGRAKRRPKSVIRIVYTALPERKTWYECTRCGGEAYREDNHGRHCRLCGSTAVQREWVRPDIAQVEERTRRRRAQFTWVGTGPGRDHARYTEITGANPQKPLPDGEYRVVRKIRPPDLSGNGHDGRVRQSRSGEAATSRDWRLIGRDARSTSAVRVRPGEPPHERERRRQQL
jgi:hypothetical protein